MNLPTPLPILALVADRNFGYYHARSLVIACLLASLLLHADLLLPFLVGQNRLFVLLKADEVKVQVLNAILLQQILSDQATQVDSSLSQGVILVERGVSLNGTEVATVVAHVK